MYNFKQTRSTRRSSNHDQFWYYLILLIDFFVCVIFLVFFKLYMPPPFVIPKLNTLSLGAAAANRTTTTATTNDVPSSARGHQHHHTSKIEGEESGGESCHYELLLGLDCIRSTRSNSNVDAIKRQFLQTMNRLDSNNNNIMDNIDIYRYIHLPTNQPCVIL